MRVKPAAKCMLIRPPICILTNAILVYGAPKLGHVLFDPLSYEANKYDKLKAFLRDVIAQNETIKQSTKFCSSCIEDRTEKIKPKSTTTEVPKNIARNNEAPAKIANKVSDLLKLFENAMEKIKVKNPLRQGSDDEPRNKEPGAEYDFNGGICKIVNSRLLCGYNKNKGELKTDEFIDVGNGCRLLNERVECGYESPPFTGNIRRPPARDDHSLRSRQQDDLKNIARTVLRAISEQESQMDSFTNDSKTGSPSNAESVSPKSTEDITNSTPSTVTDINSTITDVTASNSTLTTITELLVNSTTEGTTESSASANLTTETTQNITSSSSISPKLVTMPILEYLFKYFLPLRTLDELSLPPHSVLTTLAPSTPTANNTSVSNNTLTPSTLNVTSDLLVSETAVESSSSESEEFLTNDIEVDVDVAENSSVSTSTISEVTGNSTTFNQQTNDNITSLRSPKIVRRSAEAGSEETTSRPEAAREGNKPSRWCVEKGDRIVCYYADNSFVLD